VANADLPEGVERIPLKTIHINKCPVLAPLSVIRSKDAERLEIDIAQHHVHLARIQSAPFEILEQKLAKVFTRSYADTPNDPDLMIYSGGFFSHKDKAIMQKIRQTPPEGLPSFDAAFDDERLPEMLFRYRARNFPETLNADEVKRWDAYCHTKLNDRENPGNLQNFRTMLTDLTDKLGDNHKILIQLKEFAARNPLI